MNLVFLCLISYAFIRISAEYSTRNDDSAPTKHVFTESYNQYPDDEDHDDISKRKLSKTAEFEESNEEGKYGYESEEYGSLDEDVYINESSSFVFLIAGGIHSKIGRYAIKSMVSIRSRTPRKFFGDNHFCAGVIVANDVVLTAAHCIMDKRKVTTPVRNILIVAGTPHRLNMSKTTVMVKAKAVRAHPNFRKKNTNDVGLIFLKHPLPNNSEIVVHPLPTKQFQWSSFCIVVGWGRMYYNGPMADRPLTSFLTINSVKECGTENTRFQQDGVLCSNDPIMWYKDPCRGDSGGGLFCDGQLQGITSWTISCGSNNIPSLFSDVYYNRDWIKKEIAKGCSSLLNCKLILITFPTVAILLN